MSEEMIAYVAGQIRAFFGGCVSAPSDRSLPVLVAVATAASPPASSLKVECWMFSDLTSAFGPPVYCPLSSDLCPRSSVLLLAGGVGGSPSEPEAGPEG
jgi:hypothetical protein